MSDKIKYEIETDLNINGDEKPKQQVEVPKFEAPDFSKNQPKIDESLKPKMPEFNPTSSMPSDNLGAKGYDSNVDSASTLPETPKVPANGLDKKSNLDESKTKTGLPDKEQSPAASRHETAPDIGKDYDSSGVNQNPNLGVPGDNVNGEQNNNQSNNDLNKSQQGVNPEQGQNQEQNQSHEGGLDKKNDLEGENNHPDINTSTKSDEKNPEAPDSSKRPQDVPQQTGNGYGALNKPKQNNGANDGTARARQNLEHSKRMQQGAEEEKASSKTAQSKGSSLPKDGLSNKNNEIDTGPSLGAKLRNGLSMFGKGRSKNSISDGGKGGKNVNNSFKSNLKKKLVQFILTHPTAAIITGVCILIFLILIFATLDDISGGKGGTHCTYNLSGVIQSGEVKLEGLQVELINCDGTASNYTVLETVDFEKYVLGVALAEIGPSSPDEAIKSQIVAARGFALTRNGGMCPGNPDNCFYGYNASTGKIRMRACEADQVYWDYEKDIYRQDRGAISLYSPEINSGTLWKSALGEQRKTEVLALAEEVKGKVLVDSSNKVVSTNYVASVSSQFLAGAQEGKTYDQILAEVYTESDGFSSGDCTSYGNIDYGDYVLSSDGHEILHEPLDSFLTSKGTSLDEFNSLIADNVEKAGYGTRAGVVAAAVTLIAELGNNYNVKVPYFWGGGHADGVVIGALGKWGSTACHTYANDQSYDYCGLDCSGFVPWAIKNGGFDIAQMLASDFQYMSGAKRVSLSSSAVLEPGDLLESSGHIVLVVGVEESSGSYICAEASGNSAGVLFTRRPFNSSGYWGVKMDGFYETHARSQ